MALSAQDGAEASWSGGLHAEGEAVLSAALLLAFLAIGCVPHALGLKVRANAVLHTTKIPVASLPMATTRYCIGKFLHLRYGVGFLAKYVVVKFCMDHGALHWACLSQLKGLQLYLSPPS